MNEIATQPPAPPRSADAVLAAICFDANGLVPAIAQQHDTGEVLMMAWMNTEAVGETLTTGRVCYFSAAAAGCGAKARPPARCSI